MIRRFLILSFLASACAAGCSDSAPTQTFVADGPHNGLVIPLANNAGFAEVLQDEGPVPASRTRGRVPKSLVIYFLGPDKKSALSPAPTGVSVKVAGESAGSTISLSPAPDAKDPAGGGRFAASVGENDLSGRRAELTADLAGQKIALEFQGLR